MEKTHSPAGRKQSAATVQGSWWERVSLRLIYAFEKMVLTWVSSQSIEYLNARDVKEKSVVYVMKYRSLIDMMVARKHCKMLGMPEPTMGVGPQHACRFLFLGRRNMFRVDHRSSKRPPVALRSLLLLARGETGSESPQTALKSEVLLVPVSVFWGRRPQRGDQSFWKWLFFDQEWSGWFQRLIMVMVQGRDAHVLFGNPLDLGSVEEQDIEQSARKLRRLFRIHFRSMRTTFLGPDIPTRSSVIDGLAKSSRIRTAVEVEHKRSGKSVKRLQTQARKYLNEISSNITPSSIGILNMLLTRLWKRLYTGVEVQGVEQLKAKAEGKEIVLLPCHKSHMDYLLIAWVMYHQGFFVPHTAAGINLNFWPSGPILRWGGAFYMRRTFKGNRLYSEVFTEYFQYLLRKGFVVNYFLEGGRSRTGALLKPKKGLLSMTLEGFLENADKDILFVPINVHYDRIIETRNYTKELAGARKKPESLKQLIRARRGILRNMGRVYIQFGDAFSLQEYLEERGWKGEAGPNMRSAKPQWFGDTLDSLAKSAMLRINENMVLSPTSLVATGMLSVPSRAMGRESLVSFIDLLISCATHAPVVKVVHIPERDAGKVIEEFQRVHGSLSIFENPADDILFLEEHHARELGYYRNMVKHGFVLHALLALFFSDDDKPVDIDEVEDYLDVFGVYFESEYTLPGATRNQVASVLEFFAELKLIRSLSSTEKEQAGVQGAVGKSYVVARDDAGDTLHLQKLGYIFAKELEQLAIALNILSLAPLTAGSDTGDKEVEPGASLWTRGEFEERLAMTTQRMSMLSGAHDPDWLLNPKLFGQFTQMLISHGWLLLLEDERVQPCVDIQKIAQVSLRPVRQSFRYNLENSLKNMGGRLG